MPYARDRHEAKRNGGEHGEIWVLFGESIEKWLKIKGF